jgi:ABC-type transporter Mla maintaining outer membrane lipid asymmetry ATPase subunit MlaF
VIRVQKLYKAFGDQPVLRGLDLDVATAEIMVIIGRSGGGKSVLLKHLIGLLRPDSGAILVDGTDITRLRGSAPAIGRIFLRADAAVLHDRSLGLAHDPPPCSI